MNIGDDARFHCDRAALHITEEGHHVADSPGWPPVDEVRVSDELDLIDCGSPDFVVGSMGHGAIPPISAWQSRRRNELCVSASCRSEVAEHIQQDDNRQWNSDQPEQGAAHRAPPFVESHMRKKRGQRRPVPSVHGRIRRRCQFGGPTLSRQFFATQLTLPLLFGRMLGEVLARMGPPAIFGQLLAGVLPGPSVFGAYRAARR